MSDDKRVDVEFGAKIGGLVAGAREAAAVVKESTGQMAESAEALTGAFEAVMLPLAALTAVLAGGEFFKESIQETAELASHLEVLSQKTGMAVEDLSRLRYAADLSHISVDAIDGAVARLARSMQDAARDGASPAAEAFKAMGISVKDADGNLRPMKDVLGDVADRFATYEDGAAKSALAMNIFGRSGAELVPLLNKGAEGIAALGAEQDKLNATMTEEQVRVSVEYENSMKRMEAGVRGLKQEMAVALMPALTALADAFTNTSGASELLNGTMEVVAGGFRFLGTVGVSLQFVIQETYETLRLFFQMGVSMLSGFGAAWSKFSSGDLAGAASSIRGTWTSLTADLNTANDRMKQHADSAAESMKRLYGFTEGEKDADPKEPSRTKKAPGLPQKEKKGKEGTSDFMQLAREEWDDKRLEAQKGKDDLLHIEIDFWAQKLALVKGNTKEDEQIRRQINHQIAAAELKLADDEKAAARIEVQAQREASLATLDLAKQEIQEKQSLREIDHETAAQQLRAIAAEEYDIKVAALQAEMALAEGDLQKQATIRKQALELDRAYTKELAGIQKTTTAEIAKDWEGVFDHVSNVFSQTVTGIINGTQTLRNGLRSIFQNITLDFIASKLKELQHHAAIELAKRGITTATAAHKIATEGAAAVKSLAITAATALKEIAIHAARAAAAAFAAIAAIPFVGPILAPIAAGVALTAVLALGSRIASAEGGYDIPSGVNPMTQLHAEEMVLPARLANAVRAMADGGSSPGPSVGTASGAAAGAASTSVEHHYYIHAIDAKSLEETLRRNPSAVAAGVKGAVRNGHLSRSPA